MFEASHLQHNIVSGYIQIVSDGHYLPAFWAHPDLGGPFPGLVMIHDYWGMTPHIRTQARRFAELGYYVIAPDLFDRQVATSLTQAHALVEQVGETALSHVTTALHALQTHLKCNGKIGLIGWGLGGQLALRMATVHETLRAIVIFYELPPDVTPAELRMLNCPLLAVFGDALPEKVEALRQTLETTGLSHEIVTYPEAARDFFNDSRAAFDSEAAEDAWNRSLAFLDQHLEVSRSESGPVF